MMTNDTILLTPKDVAQRLQVTLSTVYKYIRGEGLPAIRVKRMIRVREADLAAWIADHVGVTGE